MQDTLWVGQSSVRQHCDNLAGIFAPIGIFFIPISPTLTNFIVLAAVLSLFGEVFWQEVGTLIRQPFYWLTILFIALIAFSLTYTVGTHHMAHHQLVKYSSKMLCFLTLVPIFSEPIRRRLAINAMLLAAVCFTIMFCFLYFFYGITNNTPFYNNLINPIPFTFYIAISGFVFLNRYIDEPNYRVLNISALILIAVYLFFINKERTGMLVLFSLSILACIQRLHWKKVLPAIVLLGAFIILLFFIAVPFHDRLISFVDNIIQYQHGHKATSIGLRLSMFHFSLTLIQQHPWLGSGVGSYFTLLLQQGPPVLLQHTYGDPHNSYLHLGIQFGLIGLSLFIIWIIAQVLSAAKIPTPERFSAQGLLVGFIIACFCISAFLRGRTSWLYFSLLAVYMGAWLQQIKKS